jgi:hypothetical protein
MYGDFKIRFLDRSFWQPIVTKYLQHSRSVAQVLGLLWARLSRGETLLSHVWLLCWLTWNTDVSVTQRGVKAPKAMTHRCRCHLWVIGYLGVSAKKEEINLMILWESCWWRTHWKRVTLSLLLLFFLFFRHWSFKAYIAKRASIICLLCYHNMSHVYHSLHFQTKMTWRFRPRHGRTCAKKVNSE